MTSQALLTRKIDLIDDERKTPAPFMASNAPWEAPRHAYELIQSELTWFLQIYDHSAGTVPGSDLLQLEACRIIFAAETLMMQNESASYPNPGSWLRELITANRDLAQQAQFGPLRSRAESALSAPMLHNKTALFEDCPLEVQLREVAGAHWTADQKILSDSELQVEACKIVSSLGQAYQAPASNVVSNWLIILIGSSTSWLANFRQRVYNPQSAETSAIDLHSRDVPLPGNEQGNQYVPLGHAQQMETQVSSTMPRNVVDPIEGFAGSNLGGMGTEHASVWPGPVLARLLSSSLDLPDWKPTVPAQPQGTPGNQVSIDPNYTIGTSSSTAQDPNATGNPQQEGQSTNGSDHRPTWIRNNILFLNDDNFHRWLARELGRWVVATMSPNNPNCHKPSDEELRHQARCILYDE